MENKIKKINSFICLAILSLISLPCFSMNTCTTKPPVIKIQLSENKYKLNTDIENLFKQNLKLDDNIIFSQVPRGVVISIKSSVFFDDGKDEIKETSKQVLNTIGEILKEINKPCVIEGNNYSEEYQKTNYRSDWELTMVRAEKIANYLIQTIKISPQKLRAIGFGSIMPFKENVSYKGTMNKRIDFVILNYEN